MAVGLWLESVLCAFRITLTNPRFTQLLTCHALGFIFLIIVFLMVFILTLIPELCP